jgi:hypothetical protein
MLSSQVLVHGDTDAILGSGRLAVRRDRQITHIPLAAVGEVRPRGDKALDACSLNGVGYAAYASCRLGVALRTSAGSTRQAGCA